MPVDSRAHAARQRRYYVTKGRVLTPEQRARKSLVAKLRLVALAGAADAPCPYAPREVDTEYWEARCWWHRYTSRPCTALATHYDPVGDSQWQACGKHRNKGDVPISAHRRGQRTSA